MVAALLRPWRDARTWRELAHLCLDLPVGTVTFTVIVTLLATSLGLAVVAPLAVPVVWLLFASAGALGRLERSRLGALLGLELADPYPPPAAGGWWGRFVERLRSPARWKEIVYLLAVFPVGCLTFVVAAGVFSGGLALLALPAYVSALPENEARFGLFAVSGIGTVLVAVVGLSLLASAPWVVRGLASLDRLLARTLLEPRASVAQLSARLTRVEASRAAAVDAGEAERRRIERDLHDGAQQRLVALAMDLGQAREKLDSNPGEAARLVAGAHEEAKRALSDLRDLVRGIHPAILEDRGLDAALSAVVARCPVPVNLSVELAARPPAAVESTAYFVVSEALVNVARHSRATRATVSIVGSADRLVVEVADNGVGGADPARGTGLDGLRERVEAVGGRLQLLSPGGGPTTMLVELPHG
ncbi:MAG TPA: sensor histidine kinase [Acidimicrobiales bacterium]|nr:sensor histidine kinase [Acidimicrobiales bacterium]